VTIQPSGDWTGTIGPNSGVLNLSAPQTAHLDLSAVLPDPDCPIGPLPLNLSTAGGTPYNNATGSAEIVDGTFGIPAIPDDNMGGCPDFMTINEAAPLPIPGGASFADLIATFTPPLVDNDLGVNVPANITANATSPAGATVTYTATAADEDSPATATVSCTPASGSIFAIQTTTVNCTATDADDSPSSVMNSFTVTVRGAAAQLQDLLAYVTGKGPGTSFVDQVNGVLASYNAGNTADACGGLGGFISHANAQAGKMITVDQANFMVTSATQIQAVIGC
jgi:hypothetical protein